MELTQIGLAVRSARTAARMSAKELASAAALTTTALSKIETGNQKLDFKTAVNITNALHISLDDLATLAEKVSDVGTETNNVRNELASRLKSLEKSAIETALFFMHREKEERQEKTSKLKKTSKEELTQEETSLEETHA